MPDYISELEYQLLLENVEKKKVGRRQPEVKDKPDPGPESILMGKIMKYCKNEGFPCQCFRPSRRAIGMLVPGWPD